MGGFQMGANTYLGTNNHVRQWWKLCTFLHMFLSWHFKVMSIILSCAKCTITKHGVFLPPKLWLQWLSCSVVSPKWLKGVFLVSFAPPSK
jgi:hypothetical protein